MKFIIAIFKNTPVIYLHSFLLFMFLLVQPALGQFNDSSRLPGMEIKTIHSSILGEQRKIFIQTPSGMNPHDAYPVIYLLDGEVFATMAGGQVQYLSESYKIIPNLIVVAIANTDRMRDLTPAREKVGEGKQDTSKTMTRPTGGGERFVQFIAQELIPFIEKNYPVAPYRILAGHSLGGLMALYCMVHHPSIFNAYIAISPSLQWDLQVTLDQMAAVENKALANKVLFFSDANEDEAFHRNQLALDSILKQKKGAGFRYKRMFYPEETHISEPVKAFYDGIRLVYPDWHLPYNSSAFRKTLNLNVIREQYEKLSGLYGYKIVPLHDEIIQISRFFRNDPNRIADAIELLRLYAGSYSRSAVLFETLGDTYLKNADVANARESFRKAMELEPANQALKDKINKLQ